MKRIFLLSPASAAGERARMILGDRAQFPVARQLASPAGVPLGEVFAFLSGLYFRGKLTYARTFARVPEGMDGAFVITPGSGLWPVDRSITRGELAAFATVSIDTRDPRYREPLERDARVLARALGSHDEVVLLGSIATEKYVSILSAVFAERLRFPPAFVGRGDMSRGGLLLRCAEAGVELDYVDPTSVSRRGPRPPRLAPRRATPTRPEKK